jgi:predicted acyl esterase
MMNTGQLRVSHREIDLHQSTRFWPVHQHTRQQFLRPGEIVPVEIGIAPSTMFWHAGQQLLLVIAGLPAAGPSPFQPDVKNEGDHIIYGGGRYDSYLQVPIIPQKG